MTAITLFLGLLAVSAILAIAAKIQQYRMMREDNTTTLDA